MKRRPNSDPRSRPGRRPRACAIALAALLAALALGARADDAAANVPTAMLREQASAHEHGEGVGKDLAKAAALYCQAALHGDAEALFSLGWMYANGRGVQRDDAVAAYLLRAAAEQGVVLAPKLLVHLSAPGGEPPDCLRPAPPPPAAAVAARGDDQAEPPLMATIISAPRAIVELVERIAREHKVHPQLALLIMQAESGFDPQAVSPKNAQGLMQLIPETAARFKVKDPFDPKQNIRGGIAYLRWLLAYFEGDLALVAAAYNAGEGAVERHLGVPPYGETRRYVQRILEGFGRPAHPFDARVTKPSARLELIRAPRTAH